MLPCGQHDEKVGRFLKQKVQGKGQPLYYVQGDEWWEGFGVLA
ncbi:MAG: hypothetical protein VB108_01005 [Anaerolineaceae bacterium]|nr:hypothetical protein [Anaerolineaceae bacterium]